MILTNITIEEFIKKFPPLMVDSVPIKWTLYSNFEEPLEFEKIQSTGDLRVELETASIDLEENPTGITKLINPFPTLHFDSIQPEFCVDIPIHRFLSLAVDGKEVIVVFMHHGTKPIEGFPIQKDLKWGQIVFQCNEEENTQILQTLIPYLFVNNQIPRPRCPSCQGMLSILYDPKNPLIPTDDLTEDLLICQDCFFAALKYYDQTSLEMEHLLEKYSADTSTNDSEKLFQKIDGGLNLADNLKIEKFSFEFLLFRAKLLLKSNQSEDIREAKELLEDILLFASSWDYRTLQDQVNKLLSNKEKKEVLDTPVLAEVSHPRLQDITSLKPVSLPKLKSLKEIEKSNLIVGDDELAEKENEVVFNELQSHKPEDVIERKVLNKSKILNEPKIRNEPKIIEELREEDKNVIDLSTQNSNQEKSINEDIFQTILNESKIFNLKNDMQRQPKVDEKNVTNEMIPLEAQTQNDTSLDEIVESLGKKGLETVELTSSLINDKIDDISISSENNIDKKLNKREHLKAPKLEFTLPDNIPLDEDAQELEEAFSVIPDSVQLPTSSPKLQFTLPNNIPLDEDAQELGEALTFAPTVKIDAENVPKLEFILPDNIPMDEEAQELGEALLFAPQDQGKPENNMLTTQNLQNISTSKKNSFQLSEYMSELSPLIDAAKSSASRVPGYLFGIKGNIKSEGNSSPSKGIFDLFPSKLEPTSFNKPKRKTTRRHSISKPVEKEKPQVKEEISPEKMAKNYVERRKNRTKVEICPMCGKIATNCSCGYMKMKEPQ